MSYTTTRPGVPSPFARPIFLLSWAAALGLVGYAAMNLIAMPAVSPGAFVPKTLARTGSPTFAVLQVVSVLGFAFAFMPVGVMLTIRKYAASPQPVVLAGVLLCLALMLEIDNNLPVLGALLYPERLAAVPPDVALYLRQASSIRYLSFDVAGFTILYAALLVYAAVFWRTNRLLGELVGASVLSFVASIPFLWVSGVAAVALLAVAVLAVAPVPVILGRIASE